MTDTIQAKTYAESRTGRGDQWYEQIKKLKTQIDALKDYEAAHKAFSLMVEDGLRTLALNDSREIVREEILRFCAGRMVDARKTIEKNVERVTELEHRGLAE